MALRLTQPLTEMSTRNISRRWPVLRADKHITYMCRLSSNLGASTSGNPQGLYSDFFTFHRTYTKGKGKAVPLQAWSGPEGSKKLRFPDFMTTAQDGGKVVSLKHRPHLPQENTPGTHFYKRLCRPQCHSAIGRIICQ